MTNYEIRRNDEARRPKGPTDHKCGFQASGFLRPSAFGFRASLQAFTLIELMVVIGIMGIIMGIGIPFAFHAMHKESLTKAVSEVVEVCSHARARAILQGHMTEVVFHPKEGQLEVDGGGGGGSSA